MRSPPYPSRSTWSVPLPGRDLLEARLESRRRRTDPIAVNLQRAIQICGDGGGRLGAARASHPLLVLTALLLLTLAPLPLARAESHADDQAPASSIDDLFADPDAGVIEDEGATGTSGAGTQADSWSGDNDLDDLFGDSTLGVVEEDQPIGDATDPDPTRAPRDGAPGTAASPGAGSVNLAALTTAPLALGGTVTTEAGISLPLGTFGPYFSSYGAPVLGNAAAGYTMSVSFSLTARPAPHLRFAAGFSTALDPATGRFGALGVGSVVVDYTLRDTIFFQIGNFGMTYGQARVVPNVTNIVSDVETGAGFRATVPTGPGTATGVIFATPASAAGHSAGDPRAFVYVGHFETTRGFLSTGAAARVQAREPVTVALYSTAGLARFDLSQEFRLRIDRQAPQTPLSDVLASMTQLVWESRDTAWLAVGEYLFYTGPPAFTGHTVAMGLRFPAFLPRDWRPEIGAQYAFESHIGGAKLRLTRSNRPEIGLDWTHSFRGHNGTVLVGLSGNLAPNLEGKMGVPISYGPTAANIPLGLTATLSFSF